jgi:uncharacterized membrane protein
VTYLVVKWLHVISSTVLFGTGLGSAYYMFFASRTRDARVAFAVVRLVVIADWIFTTTTIVVQPLSGLYMAHLAGIPWTTRWIAGSLVLYLLAGACWLPVVWMQVRMRDMAAVAAQRGEPLPERYWTFLHRWTALGIPAFAALVVVFWLMIAKPA